MHINHVHPYNGFSALLLSQYHCFLDPMHMLIVFSLGGFDFISELLEIYSDSRTT